MLATSCSHGIHHGVVLCHTVCMPKGSMRGENKLFIAIFGCYRSCTPCRIEAERAPFAIVFSFETVEKQFLVRMMQAKSGRNSEVVTGANVHECVVFLRFSYISLMCDTESVIVEAFVVVKGPIVVVSEAILVVTARQEQQGTACVAESVFKHAIF